MSSLDSDGDVAVGRIGKARGLQGEAFLLPLTDYPERFQALETVCVLMPDGKKHDLKVSSIRQYGKRMGIRFSGVNTPNEVSKFRGGTIQVSRDSVYDLPEDSFYVFEVIGMTVESESGEVIGKVQDVISNPAQDVYVVERDGEEVLLPAVRELMKVDRDARRIVVRNVDGLL